jgi:hypothetical protein
MKSSRFGTVNAAYQAKFKNCWHRSADALVREFDAPSHHQKELADEGVRAPFLNSPCAAQGHFRSNR